MSSFHPSEVTIEDGDDDGNRDEITDLEKTVTKVDEAIEMLQRLGDCKDPAASREVMKEIDRYLEDTRRSEKSKKVESRDKFNKTIINGAEDSKREKKAEKLKQEGNQCFAKGDYSRAVELYTSSILELDSNPLVFTNRAQARIHLGQFQEAAQDCRAAIKLKPDLVKAQVHLARALKGLEQFQAALDVLEIAEESSKGYEEVIKKYRGEIIDAMKKSIIKEAKEITEQED